MTLTLAQWADALSDADLIVGVDADGTIFTDTVDAARAFPYSRMDDVERDCNFWGYDVPLY